VLFDASKSTARREVESEHDSKVHRVDYLGGHGVAKHAAVDAAQYSGSTGPRQPTISFPWQTTHSRRDQTSTR
jgi:hypothetical protein